MRSQRLVQIVECHAGGEVGDVVVGGVTPPPGDTMWAKSRAIAQDGKLKDFLLHEPRGGVFRHVNLLTPPIDPQADIGCIIMEPETCPPMSGSNTICVTTVVLETGIIPMSEPQTRLTIEMPGGLVDVVAECRNGKVESVTLRNLPSFVDQMGARIDVPGLGDVTADVVFGGDSFVIVPASAVGFSLVANEARDLVKAGMQVVRAAKDQLGFRHPTLTSMDDITFCLFAGDVETENGRRVSKHAVAIKPGKLDRSATGTGCSARLAVMRAQGLANVGDEVVFRSVLGSQFVARVEEDTTLAGRPAIVPSVTGTAWISGTRQLMLDPSDPWPTGYKLNDTWPSDKT